MESKLRFTNSEELANSISHGIGFILSIFATTLLIYYAKQNNDIWDITSTTVFSATLILLYLSSVMNHSLAHGKAKDFFHNFDQIAIYLLIAGTYTPLALAGIRHDWGWVMFGIEWFLAVAGILIKVFIPNKFEKGVNVFIITSYVIMGWLLLLFIGPLTKILTNSSFAFDERVNESSVLLKVKRVTNPTYVFVSGE